MPKTTHQTPHIFISHSSKDIDFVKRLASDLCYVLGDDDAVWFDVLGLHGGEAWWPKIVREINARDVFILIISPDAMKSPWVDDELQIAWRHKNAKTATRKLIIPIHFRECKNVADYLKNLQWVQFLPPETYQSAFNKLLRDLKVSFDARTSEFIRKLETLNADFARPVIPKFSVNFDAEKLEETLNLLGKYTAYYISQSRWDQVLLCVEEALPLASNDPHWLNIKQEALVRLGHREGLSTAQVITEINGPNNSRQRENIKAQSSNKGASRHKSNVKSSPVQYNTMSATEDLSQPPDLKGISRIQNLMTKSSQNYLKNFADFIPRLIRENNRFLQAICLIDVFIIPIVLGLSLQPNFVLVFLTGLFLSFLAFIVAPVTKDRKVAIIPIVFFSLSWISIGLLLNWFINQFINILLNPSSKPTIHLDYKFAIVFGALSLLCSFSVHLFVIFNTDYIEELIVHKAKRKRSKR